MKIQLTAVLYCVLGLSVAKVTNGFYVRVDSLQDVIALCVELQESVNIDCDWLLNYALEKNRPAYQDEREFQNSVQKSHVRPRLAIFDDGKYKPRYPFGGSWKSQAGRNTIKKWSAVDEGATNYPYRALSSDGTKRTPFHTWGGKRGNRIGLNYQPLESDASMKRDTAFSSWGGKRTSKFYSWGGKRSISDEENKIASMNDEAAQQPMDDRKTTKEYEMESYNNLNNEKTDIPAVKMQVGEHDRKKRSADMCFKTDGSSSGNLEELFKEFLNWSKKRPEQKKGSFYHTMKIRKLREPHIGESFFPWGGKRNFQKK